ncbi:MAG TPA: hypothetical protein VEI83_16180 [Acidimicrobiales bacterium]|nr:hypothetical protein [Acidimicrobiales bacterium]
MTTEPNPADQYQAAANEANGRDYLASEMPPAEVEVPAAPMSALAVRFTPAVLAELRAVAEDKGVGVTQLVRTWVTERLDAERSPKNLSDFLDSAELRRFVELVRTRFDEVMRHVVEDIKPRGRVR